MSPDDLVELFAPFAPVQARRMFGGVGVFAEGLMFALHARGDLYLKVDAAFSERLAQLGSAPFGYTTATREVTLPYWRLPDEALDDEDLRRDLFRAAFQVARAAAAGKAKTKTKIKKMPKAASLANAASSEPPDLDALGLGGGTAAPSNAMRPKRGRQIKPVPVGAVKKTKPKDS